MSEVKELRVLSVRPRFNNLNACYIVDNNGKQVLVPMFRYQELEPAPETIKCELRKGKLVQCESTLLHRYYSKGQVYVFKVKNKFGPTQNHYELIDERLEDSLSHKPKLLFTDSTKDLSVGQIITCKVREITTDRLQLRLEDAHPLLVVFYALETVFPLTSDDNLRSLIDKVFAMPFMDRVSRLHSDRDGRWLCEFSRHIEEVIYIALSEYRENVSLLRKLCTAWITMIERSSFIGEMGDNELSSYGADLERSIEICEDFLDALSTPDISDKVCDAISSLNPQFYQFRLERRFRFLAFAFRRDPSLLRDNIALLLEKVRDMGEERCCMKSIALALIDILTTYSTIAQQEVEHKLSYEQNMSSIIKQCALALCYAIKIMYHLSWTDTPLYVCRLYQVLSLLNTITRDDKQKLLLKAYYSFFMPQSPSIMNYSWKKLYTLVMEQPYTFCNIEEPDDAAMTLVYSNDKTQVVLRKNRFSLSPRNVTDKELKSLPLLKKLTVALCYNKSLSNIEHEEKFQAVREMWNDVRASVFAPARAVQKKVRTVTEGDEIDIYITEIIDEETAWCKAVDYAVEGQLKFNDMFFYRAPRIPISSFCGEDGSPLLFPAIYSTKDGVVTFTCNDLKNELAEEHFNNIRKEGMPITCYITKMKDTRYIAIDKEGFFLNFDYDGAPISPHTFVEVEISYVNRKGYAQAQFVGLATETFDNAKAYVKYVKALNSYSYGGEQYTLADDLSSTTDNEDNKTKVNDISCDYLTHLASIVYKLSLLSSDLRTRYGYLSICTMLAEMSDDEQALRLYTARRHYAQLLYEFAKNNRLTVGDVNAFCATYASAEQQISEEQEMCAVIRLLGRYERYSPHNPLDETLVATLSAGTTPLLKELSRLILSNNILGNIINKAIKDKILSLIGAVLHITVTPVAPVTIGVEEDQTHEFKTSIVFPPNGRGVADETLQAENICRVISAMLNTDGGTLYVGVNDLGACVGVDGDLEYFAGAMYDAVKARDKFRNHFSYITTQALGPDIAAKLTFDFEDIQGYDIFKVTIPAIPNFGGDYKRVGTTCQRIC